MAHAATFPMSANLARRKVQAQNAPADLHRRRQERFRGMLGPASRACGKPGSANKLPAFMV